MWRRLWVLLGVVAALLSSSAAYAGRATELAKQRQAAVFAASDRPAARRALEAMFDYDAMADAIESKRWAKLAPAKRAELRSLLRRALVRNHEVLLATKHKHQLRVTFKAEKAEGSATIVRAEVTPASNKHAAPISIDYVVKGSQIVELRIEGLKQIKTARRQLDRKLRKGKVDAVIAKLRTTTAAPRTPLSNPFPSKRPANQRNSNVVVAAAAGVVVVAAAVVALWWRAKY